MTNIYITYLKAIRQVFTNVEEGEKVANNAIWCATYKLICSLYFEGYNKTITDKLTNDIANCVIAFDECDIKAVFLLKDVISYIDELIKELESTIIV